jgi:protocatechuate 3,4-dioxygenase beta subunit
MGAFNGAFRRGWVGPLPGQATVLTTSADGKFRLSGVGRDRAVAFRLEGRAIMTVPVAAQGASFEHRADISRPLRGVVRDQATGKPLAGVTVWWQPGYNRRYEVKGLRHYMAITDKEGRYELLGTPKGYASGSGYVAARPAAGQLYLQNTVRAPGSPGLGPVTVDIELTQGVTVTGKVTDKSTGKPVANAVVEYWPIYPNPYVVKRTKGTNPRSEAITGPDGSYALTALPGKGMIGVVAPKPDVYGLAYLTKEEIKAFLKIKVFETYGLMWQTGEGGGLGADGIEGGQHGIVLFEPGENDTELVKDIALEPARRRQGRVVGPDGQPLTGVTVSGLSTRELHSETLKGAEFTVRGINPKAPRSLTFYHKDKNLGFYLKELPDEKLGPLTSKLQPLGSVSGRVVDQDGQPVAGKRVEIEHGEGGGWKQVTTDKEGRFRVEGMVPGKRYMILKPNAERSPLVYVVAELGNKDLGNLNTGK